MRGVIYLLYGFTCYLIFFLTFLYSIAFVGDFLVPYTVDRGNDGTLPSALVIDAVLLGIFALQHSGMARQGFKRWLTAWLPSPIERSTYVLLTCAAMILMFWQWRPLPAVIWDVQQAWAVGLLYALFAAGWLLVFTATFVINHWDLFGLRQAWLGARGNDYSAVVMQETFYYRVIRHPLILGFIIAFWATPEMTAGHLLFSVATTAYMVLAVKWLEERDLVAQHGEAYRDYQRRVPMLCPWPRHPRQAPSGKPQQVS